MVEALLDSSAMRLVISSEFARKQGFKLKRIDRPILSSSQIVDLVFLYFIFHFHFHFVLFLIFRTVRIRVRSDWSQCHISHNLMVWSQH